MYDSLAGWLVDWLGGLVGWLAGGEGGAVICGERGAGKYLFFCKKATVL